MVKKALQSFAPILAALVLGIASGYYLAPARVKTVEVIKIVEKKHVKKNVDTETRIVARPDGSTETVIKEHDGSTEDTNKTTDSTKTKVVERDGKWLATILVGVDRKGLAFEPSASNILVSVQRNLIFGLYVGPYVSVGGDFGVGISLKF